MAKTRKVVRALRQFGHAPSTLVFRLMSKSVDVNVVSPAVAAGILRWQDDRHVRLLQNNTSARQHNIVLLPLLLLVVFMAAYDIFRIALEQKVRATTTGFWCFCCCCFQLSSSSAFPSLASRSISVYLDFSSLFPFCLHYTLWHLAELLCWLVGWLGEWNVCVRYVLPTSHQLRLRMCASLFCHFFFAAALFSSAPMPL